MSTQPSPITLPLPAFAPFDTVNYGTLQVPAGPVRFGFQVDLSPNVVLREAIFGLVQQNADAQGKSLGFAVRIDLERGEIWDLVNESGLIGWVEQPIGFSVAGGDEPLLLSLEIERVGSALLPKLQIGGEEWLYPAIRSVSALDLQAIAGCIGSPSATLEPSEVFSSPSLWSEGKTGPL
jgi:hypothetical protein